MKASVFLGQAFRLELQVQTKLQQIADLRALASHVTSFTGNEPVSHTRDVTGMQNTIAKILEEEESLNARIDRLVDAKREIREVIDCVEDVTLRLILEKRYLLFQQWDEIAIDLGMVVYCNHIDRICFNLTQPLRRMETEYSDMRYKIPYIAQFSEVRFLYPSTVRYMDAI